MKRQNNKYKYNYTLANNIVLKKCQDFNLDLRFVYYYDNTKKFGKDRHFLIDRKSGHLFLSADNYPRLKNIFINKLNKYEQFISTPEYIDLCLKYKSK